MATALSSLRAPASFSPLRVAPAPAPAAVVAMPAGKAVRGAWLRAQATYNVKLITPEAEVELQVPDDVYILDQAEEEGIEHSSCPTRLLLPRGLMLLLRRQGRLRLRRPVRPELPRRRPGSRGVGAHLPRRPTSHVVIETHEEEEELTA